MRAIDDTDKELEKLVKHYLYLDEEVFADFIIMEMGIHIKKTEILSKELKQEAFYEFRKRIDFKEIASLPTMKRWFGINGYSCPSRENVFKICYALGISTEKAGEYLTKGIFEPSFQANDYEEIFFFYGLENHLSYQEILEMIHAFEEILIKHMFEKERMKSSSHTTNEIVAELHTAKSLNKEGFMLWMRDHADWFKGYSKTTQNVLMQLRKKIVSGIREEAKRMLEFRLSEIGYEKWLLFHPKYRKNSRSGVYAYIRGLQRRKEKRLSETEYTTIRELAQIAYAEKETNTKIYESLYDNRVKSLPYLSQKRLSDLFNVPSHKVLEKELRMAEVMLKKKKTEETCPEKLIPLLKKITKGAFLEGSAGDAIPIIEKYRKEHRRRTLMLHREDLLPLIYQVALNEYRKKGRMQKKAEAKEFFVTYANTILTACNMEEINIKYKLDALLLGCFGSGKEYDYSDIVHFVAIFEEES